MVTLALKAGALESDHVSTGEPVADLGPVHAPVNGRETEGLLCAVTGLPSCTRTQTRRGRGRPMAAWTEYTDGERIKLLRGKEMNQEQLAEKAGLSVKTVQKAEQGRDRVSLPTLMKIAAALGSDVSVILGQQAPRRAMKQDERLMLRRISSAVHDTGAGYVPDEIETAPMVEMEAVLGKAWHLYWSGRYRDVGALLPDLLRSASATAHSQGNEQQLSARGMLSDVYRIAGYVANLLGSRELAYAAIGHAKICAEISGDPLRTAQVASGRSWVYMRDVRMKDALELATRAALDIEPRYSDSSPERLTVYGNHMTFAAVVASRMGNAELTSDLLSQAHAAGARLGREYRWGGALFGPVHVDTQAVGINVSIGKIGKALAIADGIHDLSPLTVAARSRYKLDVAMARCDARQWDTSLDLLLEACTENPEWARLQAMPGVIANKIGSVTTAKLRKLSQVIGAPLVMR